MNLRYSLSLRDVGLSGWPDGGFSGSGFFAQ